MKNKAITILLLICVIFASISNINIVQANTTKGSSTNSTKGSNGSLSSGSSSSSSGGSSLSDVITGGDTFIDSGKQGSAEIDIGSLKNASSSVYNILLICGVIIAVLIGAILGIKFMLGSVEEKAEIKAALVPFVIGCIVVFGAFGIWKIVVRMGNDFLIK